MRTVHIPTATPLTVDFPETEIDALAWEPQAEGFAVVIESPHASQSLLSMTYAGEKRREVIAPSARLDVSIEPIGGVLVMRPSAMRYNERLPIVLWLDPHPFAWSDARAALMRNARVAIAIAPEANGTFWSGIERVAWIDSSRKYIVDPGTRADPGTRDEGRRKAASGGPRPSSLVPGSSATVIEGDWRVPAGRFTRSGNALLTAPSVVQSFAAAFIADDMKGTPPPNGRR